MSSIRTYKGNCHCGANRFEADLPEITSAISCTCTLCTKEGYLWGIPSPDAVRNARGDDSTVLKYSSAALSHEVCNVCGVGLRGTHSSGPLKDKLLINVRTLWGINPFKLETETSDGISFESPEYQSSPFPGIFPTPDGDNLKLYTGSCHCGAIHIALKSKRLSEVEVKEDNCSICARNAHIGVYPQKDQVSIVGQANGTVYAWGRKFGGGVFCKTCGVNVYGVLYGPPKEVVDRLSDEKKAYVKSLLQIQPLSVRALDAVEWDQINILREDEGQEGYTLSD